MESEIRALIVPLADRLIKQLSEKLQQAQSQHLGLFGIELLVGKLLALMAVDLITGLIALLFQRGYEGASITCAGCGGPMKFHTYLRRTLISSFGRLSYERAYYYCQACRRGVHPLDHRLGLTARVLSPRLQRVLAFLGGYLSFGVVEKALQECYDLQVSDEAIRQVAEETGALARAWEEAQQRRYAELLPAGAAVNSRRKTWIIEVDGKRVGHQDGSWSEVKVGVIYEAAQRVEVHPGRHELIKREIVARRCGWEEFAGLFWAAMQRAGVQHGDRLVALADGAEAMEQIFAFVAPEAERVRDFYHVAQRIHAIGEVRFGSASAEGQRWIRAQLQQLKASEVGAVIRSIAHLKLDGREAHETREKVVSYLQKNREAMDYAPYQGAGLPIGSGAVEGGCRLIGARTNGCGRRWSLEGCDRIVALRVAVLNNRLDVIKPKPVISLKAA